MITILFLRLPVLVVLLFVWSAIPREGDLDTTVAILGFVMVAQGLVTWRYLATKKEASTSAPGASR